MSHPRFLRATSVYVPGATFRNANSPFGRMPPPMTIRLTGEQHDVRLWQEPCRSRDRAHDVMYRKRVEREIGDGVIALSHRDGFCTGDVSGVRIKDARVPSGTAIR